MAARKLWEPSQAAIESAQLTQFARYCVHRYGLQFNTYPEFYRWSCDSNAQFWGALWDWAGVRGRKGEHILVDGHRMPGAKWFPDARLNFAENLLRRRDGLPGSADALVYWDETGFRRRMSYGELHAQVSRCAQAMRAAGLKPGDRVAAFIPNMPETCVLALAAISVGAVWSSCSPDFGTDGVLDRFGQTEPKLFFCADGYLYNGKAHDSIARVREIVAQLPGGEAGGGGAQPRRQSGRCPDPQRAPLRGLDLALQGRRDRIRTPALRPPGLHPVHLGDHRQAQVHRARRGRLAALGPQDVQAAVRRGARTTASTTTRPATGSCGTCCSRASPPRRPSWPSTARRLRATGGSRSISPRPSASRTTGRPPSSSTRSPSAA